MLSHQRSPKRLPRFAPLVFLAASGCLSGALPPPYPAEPDPIIDGMPQRCKNQVFVFIVQGIDPIQPANSSALREYLISQGYIKTYLAPVFYSSWYAREIHRLH